MLYYICMENKDYYNYYEILFSLRKEYLKNQEIINQLLSHVKITDDPFNEYESNVVFKTNSKDSIDSLILIINKRQSCIRIMLDTLYRSLVYGDSDLKNGYFSYSFRLSEGYVYLLDASQDGRYLNAKVEIINPNEFIELYNQIMKKAICKHGKTYLSLENGIIKLSNNGIHLFHTNENDYRKSVRLDYDGIEDYLLINNPSYLESILRLKINKNDIPYHFESIIDSNMDSYSFTIQSDDKSNGFYIVEDHDKELILKPKNDKGHILRQ